MKSKKTIIICALVTILILGGVISAVSLLFNHPLRIEKPTFIYIDRDDTADSVYVKLQRDLNATHLTGFKMLAVLFGVHIGTGVSILLIGSILCLSILASVMAAAIKRRVIFFARWAGK